MWLESETNRLHALIAKYETPDISTILQTDEIATIQDLSSTEIANIRNSLFVPQVTIFYIFLI